VLFKDSSLLAWGKKFNCKKTGDFHFKISRVCKSDRQQNEAYSQNLSYLFIEPEIKFYVSLLSRQTS
jgi:hypothetical protein